MSALDGWLDICRTGTWIDARGQEVEVTEDTLDGLVASFATQDPVPVVIGHPSTDAPAWAWVDQIRRSGDRLQAKLRDVQAQFRGWVESNLYTGRSIAFTRTGTLRHVGFLGGRPPAVHGLAPTQFASEPDHIIAFALDGDDRLWQLRAGIRAMARVARSWREHLIATSSVETANEVISEWDIESITQAADAVEPESGMSAPQARGGIVNGTPTNQPDDVALAARQADLDAREAALAAREEQAKRTAALAAAGAALAPHVEAGRVLPAERASLAALLASLPDDETVITFAAPAGEGEVSEKPRTILERLLASIPARVQYGELAGGEIPGPGGGTGPSNEEIAQEARALVAQAQDRGETLSSAEAVTMVRRKRGLTDGGAS